MQGQSGSYHSARHEADNVQHLDSHCPSAAAMHLRCSCPQQPRSCRVCGVRGRVLTEAAPEARAAALYDECVKVARRGGTTFYSAIAPLVGLDMSVAADRATISGYLDQISRSEYLKGRPLLSAVVVRKDQSQPGKGFFDLVHELGLHDGDGNDRYWARELGRVHQHWGRAESA